jgi:hypothetical protein
LDFRFWILDFCNADFTILICIYKFHSTAKLEV